MLFFFLKELGKSLAFFVVYCTDIILLLCIHSKSDKEVGKNFYFAFSLKPEILWVSSQNSKGIQYL